MTLPDIVGLATKYDLQRELLSDRLYGTIDGEEQYNRFIDDLKSLGLAFATTHSRTPKCECATFKLRTHGTTHEMGHDTSTLLPYDGMPFLVVKTTYRTCVQGGTYKQQLKSPSNVRSHKRGFCAIPTKKVDCPATMIVRCLKVFNEDCYKAKAPNYDPGSWEIRKILKKLKKDLKTSSPPTGMLRFMIIMSSPEEHNHTPVSTKLNGIIHPRLQEEIHTFVDNNICSTKTMKIHLEEVVGRMFRDGDRPQPDRLNRCYYPSDQVIRYHMHKALYNTKKSKFDQDGLEACIETWKTEFPDDKFTFRPYEVATNNSVDEEPACSTLLFCHQTKWQQDLLARYGNNISLLDTTYKTTNYDLPLFFIVVKTNSGYCVVGTFVVQSESSVLIAEALSQLKAWNPDWEPKYFMTNNSEAEISALEGTFPQSTVYICAFHREQSWHRWLMKAVNVSKTAVAPLKKLWRDIATSHTEEEYMQNVSKMYNNIFYIDNTKAQEYFTKEWLPVHFRWASAFYTEDFLSNVHMNNGVESQSKVLKHAYLKKSKNNTLTGLIRTVIQSFLPDILQNYSVCNSMANNSNYKLYDVALPAFLENRPMSFIEHVTEQLEKGKEYDSQDISDMGEGQFFVRSELDKDEWYKVDFKQATCLCFDFSKWRFPCKHMCAVFIHTEWGFDKLPLSYRENPYITVDVKYTTEIEELKNRTLIDHSYDLQTRKRRWSEESDTSNNEPLPNEGGRFINEKKLRLEIQQNIKLITSCSYQDFTPERLEEVSDMTRQLAERMRNLVTNSNEGILLIRTNTDSST